MLYRESKILIIKIPLLLCTRGGEIGGESSRYNTIPSLHKERRKYYEL